MKEEREGGESGRRGGEGGGGDGLARRWVERRRPRATGLSRKGEGA